MSKHFTGGMAVFVLASIVFGVIAFSKAPIIAADTPFYLRIANDLESRPADVLLAKERATWTVLTLPAILVVARSIAPTAWPYFIVAINVICMAMAAALLVSLVRMVTRSTLATAAALLFFMTAFDVVVWLRYVLTDSLFTLASTATFFFFVRALVQPVPVFRWRLQVGLALLAGFVTRATGAILIPVTGFSAWWTHREPPPSRLGKAAPWLLLLFVALAGMFARAYVFADIRRWPTEFLRPVLETYAAREKTGQVVWDRVETNRTPPRTTIDHFVIEADRFLRFFQFTTAGFSRIHNVVNVAYYVPLYLLASFGFIHGIRAGDRRRREIVVVAALWTVSIAWLHAVTLLDFDWRYRLPAMPMLILLAACGVEVAARRWQFRTADPDRASVAG